MSYIFYCSLYDLPLKECVIMVKLAGDIFAVSQLWKGFHITMIEEDILPILYVQYWQYVTARLLQQLCARFQHISLLMGYMAINVLP